MKKLLRLCNYLLMTLWNIKEPNPYSNCHEKRQMDGRLCLWV